MIINQSFLVLQLFISSLIDWLLFLQGVIASFRHYLIDTGIWWMGEMRSKMAFGLVFGVQLGQNSTLHRNLQLIGMSNLWSASGLSISLFLSAQRSLFSFVRYLSFGKKAVLHLFSLLVFWYMSGQSPSLLRAVIMSVLAIVVKERCYRQLAPSVSLVLTLMIIVALDFNYFHSLSLRFSAAAIFALIYLCPSLEAICLSLLPFNPLTISSAHSRKLSFIAWLSFGLKWLLVMLIKNFSLFLSIQLGMLPLMSIIWPEIGLLSLLVNTFLAGLAPILFLVGMIWISLLFAAGFISLFLNIESVLPAILILIVFPLLLFIEFSDYIVQIEQVVIKIPPFGLRSTIIWYMGMFLLAEWRRWRVGHALCARPSFTNLINFLNSPALDDA